MRKNPLTAQQKNKYLANVPPLVLVLVRKRKVNRGELPIVSAEAAALEPGHCCRPLPAAASSFRATADGEEVRFDFDAALLANWFKLSLRPRSVGLPESLAGPVN